MSNLWAPLIAVGMFLIGQLLTAMIWGTRVSERVKVLEREMAEVKVVRDTVTRMEAEMKGLRDDFKDLNASIRWMREPAGYDVPPPRKPRGAA